jgi:DNA-directed RNA polymerase subunit D
MDMIDSKENKITFKADFEDSLANAIRRYFNQIPVLAIDEVEILKNGSALYDEVVAHRLGLVPLKTDKISSKGGQLKLVSKKEGFVNSGELKGNVDVVYENIPITFLDKGQELELVANVAQGIGSEHVKFSPGLMFYRSANKIIMDKEFLDEVKKTCPNANIQEKGDKIIVTDDGTKEICDVCEGICDQAKKNPEIEAGKELIINIESFGQMPVKEIFKKSVDALKKDLTEVSKKVK